ncbi:hypothetical protein FV220_18950 [Methylobacterium sp. WL19]|nr:hypothetical protein FV220_18950 [Methylobacterium sp. WL19]
MTALPSPRRAGRGSRAPCRACDERRRSRSEGEGEIPDESPSDAPPHPRLPPRRADDGVVAALSPLAGRGDHANGPSFCA